MRTSASYLCAMAAILLSSAGTPILALADNASAEDVALDLSLPLDYPMILNQPVDRTTLTESLPPPMASASDIPMLGSALDFTATSQVGELSDAGK